MATQARGRGLVAKVKGTVANGLCVCKEGHIYPLVYMQLVTFCVIRFIAMCVFVGLSSPKVTPP